MNILVSGATGFIGSHLCRALLDRGHKVYGLSRSGNTERIEGFKENEQFSLLKVDITNEKELKEKLSKIKIDVVFHLASQLPSKQVKFQQFVKINIIGTHNMLKLANLREVKLFIYSSTMGVCGGFSSTVFNEESTISPFTYYDLTKYTGEVLCKIFSGKTSMKCVVLRYPSVFGRGHKGGVVYTYWKLSKHNKPIEVFSKGELYRNVVYVKDVVKANLLVMEKQKILSKFDLFVIGSENSLKMADLAEFITKELGSKSQIIPVDIPAPTPFNSILDISKAKNRLGFNPLTIQEGLKIYIKEMESEDD